MFSFALSPLQSVGCFPGKGKIYRPSRTLFDIKHADTDESLLEVQKKILEVIDLEEGMRISVQPRTFAWLALALGDAVGRLSVVE